MALSPQERTWAQLQENLRRKRQAHGLHDHVRKNNRHKKAPPIPLPRISDSASEVPLRGSHYPVIPPVVNDRYYTDDTLSLQGHNSETSQTEEDFNWPLSPQPASLPYTYSGSTQGHYAKPHAHRDPWNSSTRVAGEARPFMDFGAYGPKRRRGYQQRDGYQRDERRGRGHRVGGHKGRYVWNDPHEERAWLEDESATTVQKHYRGYRTRKTVQMLNRLQDPTFAGSYMNCFFKDILQNDLVLDVACEVLVEERSRKQKHQSFSRLSSRQTEHDHTDDIRFWLEAFNTPDIYKPVARNILLDVIRVETHSVISEGINELLEDYFQTKVIVDATNEIVADIVFEFLPDLLEESQIEVFLETTVDELIDVEIQSCVGSFLQETFARGMMPLDSSEKQVEIREVARVAETFLLDSSLLDHLLSLLTLSGRAWNTTEYTDRFLDDRILEILLSQYIGILHNRKTTQDCVPLKRLHEKIVTDVVFDTILEELSQQLEEDLLDLDEYEKS